MTSFSTCLLVATFYFVHKHIQVEGKPLSTPPRGWNSYDCYLGCVNETQVIQNAQAVVKYLKDYGYEYIVIDGGWALNETGKQNTNGVGLADTVHSIDKYGRPQPYPGKYPHASDGSGFKWLADQIHSMGLKFGIWVGRGITEAAINANTPVYGTNGTVHAKDIVDYHYQCPWAHNLYGLNMSKYGAQQYYDSLYAMYAEWGMLYYLCTVSDTNC